MHEIFLRENIDELQTIWESPKELELPHENTFWCLWFVSVSVGREEGERNADGLSLAELNVVERHVNLLTTCRSPNQTQGQRAVIASLVVADGHSDLPAGFVGTG